MIFRYSEVEQFNYIRITMVRAVLRAGCVALALPGIPEIRWFKEDAGGSLRIESTGRSLGFVYDANAIYLNVSLSGLELCHTALHELLHTRQRHDHPEDAWESWNYPPGLTAVLEDSAELFAHSFMAQQEFQAVIMPFKAMGEL